MDKLKLIVFIGLMSAPATIEGSKITDGYLDLPDSEQFDMEPHRSISWALLHVDFPSASTMDKVKTALTKAMEDTHTQETERRIYSHVLNLSEASAECPSELLDIFQSVWAQMMARFGHGLGRFYSYMRVFGQQRFELCAEKVNEKFKTNPSTLEVLDDFHRLFRQVLHLTEGSSLWELYLKLVNIHVAHNSLFLNSESMDESRSEDDQTPPVDFVTDLTGFGEEYDQDELGNQILSKCRQLNEEKSLIHDLTIVALARGLKSELIYDARLLLNEEYRRVCLAMLKASQKLEELK